MFNDQKNRINVQTILFAECLWNRRTQLDVVDLTDSRSEVVFGMLVVEHSDEIKWRLVMEAISGVAVNESTSDVIRVRSKSIDGIDRCHTRPAGSTRGARFVFGRVVIAEGTQDA